MKLMAGLPSNLSKGTLSPLWSSQRKMTTNVYRRDLYPFSTTFTVFQWSIRVLKWGMLCWSINPMRSFRVSSWHSSSSHRHLRPNVAASSSHRHLRANAAAPLPKPACCNSLLESAENFRKDQRSKNNNSFRTHTSQRTFNFRRPNRRASLLNVGTSLTHKLGREDKFYQVSPTQRCKSFQPNPTCILCMHKANATLHL
jgi:hypothetical protein